MSNPLNSNSDIGFHQFLYDLKDIKPTQNALKKLTPEERKFVKIIFTSQELPKLALSDKAINYKDLTQKLKDKNSKGERSSWYVRVAKGFANLFGRIDSKSLYNNSNSFNTSINRQKTQFESRIFDSIIENFSSENENFSSENILFVRSLLDSDPMKVISYPKVADLINKCAAEDPTILDDYAKVLSKEDVQWECVMKEPISFLDPSLMDAYIKRFQEQSEPIPDLCWIYKTFLNKAEAANIEKPDSKTFTNPVRAWLILDSCTDKTKGGWKTKKIEDVLNGGKVVPPQIDHLLVTKNPKFIEFLISRMNNLEHQSSITDETSGEKLFMLMMYPGLFREVLESPHFSDKLRAMLSDKLRTMLNYFNDLPYFLEHNAAICGQELPTSYPILMNLLLDNTEKRKVTKALVSYQGDMSVACSKSQICGSVKTTPTHYGFLKDLPDDLAKDSEFIKSLIARDLYVLNGLSEEQKKTFLTPENIKKWLTAEGLYNKMTQKTVDVVPEEHIIRELADSEIMKQVINKSDFLDRISLESYNGIMENSTMLENLVKVSNKLHPKISLDRLEEAILFDDLPEANKKEIIKRLAEDKREKALIAALKAKKISLNDLPSDNYSLIENCAGALKELTKKK